jgi:mRNA-degrading endonuclease RelE of RelBE toxin-antitoxin system
LKPNRKNLVPSSDTAPTPVVWVVRKSKPRHNALSHHQSFVSSSLAEPYAIKIADEAVGHLDGLARYAQRIVLDGIDLHLRHQPTQETRRIKPLRLNPVASWELRLGDYRILYDVAEEGRVVNVLVVGEKRGNRLYVLGKEYTAHESDRPTGSESAP